MKTDISEVEVSDEDFGPVIKKLRAFITFMRKSTAANDTLQKYAEEECGSKKTLILDAQTRRSSLQEMLQRAVELQNAIKKTAIDHKISAEKLPTDAEFKVSAY